MFTLNFKDGGACCTVAGSGNTKLDAFDDVSLVLSFNERQLCNLIDFYTINAKE
jgi:hypothetical protein